MLRWCVCLGLVGLVVVLCLWFVFFVLVVLVYSVASGLRVGVLAVADCFLSLFGVLV